MENRWLAALRLMAPAPRDPDSARVPAEPATLVAADDGRSLAGYPQRIATVVQFRKFVILRSVYHLKEAGVISAAPLVPELRRGVDGHDCATKSPIR